MTRLSVAAACTAAMYLAANAPLCTATATNEKHIDSPICAVEICKNKRARGKKTDLPVVLRYGDNLIRIVNNLKIAGVGKLWDGIERNSCAIVRSNGYGLLGSLAVAGDSNSPRPALLNLFFAPVRAVPRPLHRTPKRRQRQTVVLQIHQLPIGKPPGFRPCVLLPQGIPGLRRRRGRHDGSFVPLIRAALIAEPFPPGGQKLSALCAARPWIFVSDIRSFHPLRAKVESSAGVEPAPSRRAAGAHPHAPAAHMGGLFFPGTPSASGIGPHYKTRREGDSNPTMPPGGCLI